MAHDPYSLAFCQFKQCPNLKDDSKCKKKTCIYNFKLVYYWVINGVWKGD